MATILLVDDDVDLLEVNRAVLANRGHQVKVASSSQEAWAVLKGGAGCPPPVDVAVLDVMMESVSAGFDLARDIHAAHPTLPILVLSGIRQAHDLPFQIAPDADWLPVVKFLEKPVAPDKLAAEVEAALGKVLG